MTSEMYTSSRLYMSKYVKALKDKRTSLTWDLLAFYSTISIQLESIDPKWRIHFYKWDYTLFLVSLSLTFFFLKIHSLFWACYQIIFSFINHCCVVKYLSCTVDAVLKVQGIGITLWGWKDLDSFSWWEFALNIHRRVKFSRTRTCCTMS